MNHDQIALGPPKRYCPSASAMQRAPRLTGQNGVNAHFRAPLAHVNNPNNGRDAKAIPLPTAQCQREIPAMRSGPGLRDAPGAGHG
jgi:hypothetical protein